MCPPAESSLHRAKNYTNLILRMRTSFFFDDLYPNIDQIVISTKMISNHVYTQICSRSWHVHMTVFAKNLLQSIEDSGKYLEVMNVVNLLSNLWIVKSAKIPVKL